MKILKRKKKRSRIVLLSYMFTAVQMILGTQEQRFCVKQPLNTDKTFQTELV